MVSTVKCPNCGGPLVFDPDVQKNKCDYCLSEFTKEELEKRLLGQGLNEEEIQAREVQQPVEELTVHGYNCNNCGAEVVTSPTTTTTYCYYCHSPVLIEDRIQGNFMPEYIIPFKISKEKAQEEILNWVKGHRYVPKGFYQESQLETITGIYVPYWMGDAKADVNYLAQASKIRVWRVGDTEYTEVKDYEIKRDGVIEIKGLGEIALDQIDKDMLKSIEPYNSTMLTDFDISYLNGFYSDRYDIDWQEVKPDMTWAAQSYASRLVDESVKTYDAVEEKAMDMEVNFQEPHYVLYPVWLLTYNYHGQIYEYGVNGQSANSFGRLPLDKAKLGRDSAILALFVIVLLSLGGYFIW